jgi:battenin
MTPCSFFSRHFVILKETRSTPVAPLDSWETTEHLWPSRESSESVNGLPEDGSRMDARRRWAVVRLVLVPFMLPLFLVYLAEYFINQGLLELIYFPDAGMTHDAQYRWLQVTYQLGVFASRSSSACFTIRYIWLLAVLQVRERIIA